MRLLLLLLALLLSSACCAPGAPAQTTPVEAIPRDSSLFVEWALTIRINEAHAAFTTCGTTPTSWFSHTILPIDTAMVRAHEEAHRMHMSEFPSCRDWYLWRSASFDNAVMTEARAFCEGARVDFRHRRFVTFEEALTHHAAILTSYWFNFNFTRALLYLERACPSP